MKKSEPISKYLRKLSREELSKIKAGDESSKELRSTTSSVNCHSDSSCSSGCRETIANGDNVCTSCCYA